ncbi:DEAD/DEAH box helicase [Kribbella sp. DT2]|uniref:DEAD/DEAH box helicase n=1 Tax=Kribbella sp. DT2 TaxID=3393427 RepID=UPI003CEAA900
MSYYRDPHGFVFFGGSPGPAWRPAQRGAIGRLIGHWSIPRQPPALVSLPTGTGKTAVAVAAPYLIAPQRVLVVVPSRELRKQTVDAYRQQTVLRQIGALQGDHDPTVIEVTGLVDDWATIAAADVAVALPNSISPSYYAESTKPPRDFFDLVIIDEAHHAPARTWRAILDHFHEAAALLLTATPRRRDRQQLPGVDAYHYPVRLALDNGFYKPVHSVVLDLPPAPTQEVVDRLIATETVRIAGTPEHDTSSVLVRARTRERAEVLAELYANLGLEVATLHGGMSSGKRDAVLAQVRSGQRRAVAVVNMLGEGFDLPRLRIAAYHDKHRSLTATTQFLGRLARTDPDHPQASIVVAARDVDVHPQLLGAVRELYAEDADWAQILPGLIDDEIAEQRADTEYTQGFTAPPPSLALDAVTPSCSVVIFEVDTASGFEPDFAAGDVPDELQEGHRLCGQTILYSSIDPTGSTILVVTSAVQRPRWHASNPGLDAPTYALHLLTWRPAPRIDEPHLLMANCGDRTVMNRMLDVLGATPHVRPTDPRRLQEAFDALDRVSVSSVGVRNTYRGSVGVPTYTMFAGSSVDRGLRDADTDRRALGHAIAQIGSGHGSYSAGVSTGKGKYWESRQLSLRNYDVFTTEFASRYWLPTVAAAGRLLPNVTRGERLTSFPDDDVAVIEHNPAVRGMGWTTTQGGPVEQLELCLDPDQTRSGTTLPIVAVDPIDPETPVWEGFQDIHGDFHCSGVALEVQLGYAAPVAFEDLLSVRPPSLYFLGGRTVMGTVQYESPQRRTTLPPITYRSDAWDGVDFTSETKVKAAEKKKGISIHARLEDYLKAEPRRARHRWILCNDGPREIADYIVIEMDPGRRVTVSLWHAKSTGSQNSGVRVNDLQTVTQQAVKSRGYITDPGFWRLLGARLTGRDTPAITFVEGSERLLLLLCGENPDHPDWGIARRPPVVTGRIAVAQPGLSMNALRADLSSMEPSIAAQQVREFLTVLHDAVSSVAEIELLTCE